MKKLLLVLASFVVTAGALQAGRDPLAAYSSGALLVAAAKQAPKDVQHLAQDLAQGASAFVQNQAVPYLANNSENIKTIAFIAAVAGTGMYLAHTNNSVASNSADSNPAKKTFSQRFRDFFKK